MRYQDQIQIIENNIDLLFVVSDQVLGSRNYRVKNLNLIADALKELSEIEYLKEPILAVEETELVNVVGGIATVDEGKLQTLKSSINNLRNKASQSLGILKTIARETGNDIISIKLIEYPSLDMLGKELEKLDTIFQQVITNKSVDGSFFFHSFDVGSSWINIVVKGTVTLSLIAGLVWSSCVVRKKWLEGEYLKKQNELLGLKIESIKDIEQSQKKLLDMVVVSEAKGLIEQFDLDISDLEYENRLIHSITELSELINDGVQIVPSLVAPEDVRNLFPDYRKLDMIESHTNLLIEDKSEENQNKNKSK